MVYKASNPEFKELRELDENLEVEWEKIENVYEMNDKFFEKMDKMEKKLLRRLEERWLKVGAENHQSKEEITRLKEEITHLIEEKTVHLLKPRGIVIFGDEPTFTPQMPRDHFTTDKPKSDDHSAHHKAIAGLQKYTIWLNPTAEFQEPVVEARNAMEQWAEVEDEFEIFAQKHLLLSEPPKRTVSKYKALLAEAKAKISFKPDTWRWKAPPLLDVSLNPAKTE
ncbi:hypothetical protein UCDDS831_g03583 [Diplodia seriata]|uniref:Uncharacterized protein n=1 Tax=Diplodia seriata TaxID=420778 RepID=A0A0G2GFM9_9PEZI|nr:hypothetical protein UCDDS831_g03583 [Diplodia seriata]